MSSPITCHVLDSTLGKPGKFIEVKLDKFSAGTQNAETVALGWVDDVYTIASQTDADS